jgi:hypothetical protein
MKVVKGLAILSFFSILFGSCFDPPEFPDVPEIVFEDIVFCDVSDNSKPDSLILYIKFKDGDGDLGLDAQSAEFASKPYHYADFFQNLDGDFTEVEVTAGQLTGPGGTQFIDVFDIGDPLAGDLVFPRTRNNPAYTNLLPPYSCVDYEYREFIIHSSDTAVLDKLSKRVDTLKNESGTFYMIRDTLYLRSNPDHYNIEVDFLVKEDPNNPDPDKRFTEYDWRKERCSTFDGRFPFLSETNSALDGSLKYTMESRGFKILFGGKTMKLRIQIKDRALHRSNVIETPEFTLEGIRKCGGS